MTHLEVGRYYSIRNLRLDRVDAYYISQSLIIRGYYIFGLVHPSILYAWLKGNETNCLEHSSGVTEMLKIENNDSCQPSSDSYPNAKASIDFSAMRSLLFSRNLAYYQKHNDEQQNPDKKVTIYHPSLDEDTEHVTDEPSIASNDNGSLLEEKLRAVKLVIEKIINNLSELNSLL